MKTQTNRFLLLLALAALALNLSCIQSAEAGAFHNTASMGRTHLEATATLLRDGTVLVAGGDYTSSAELFDLSTGKWITTNSMKKARHIHTATSMSDGKLLVVGGADDNGSPLSDVELYDPATGNWTVTGSLNVARESHTATLLTNGKVLVIGGRDGNYKSFGSAELYDPAAGTWTTTDALANARFGHTATLLPDGKVLVSGGTSTGFDGFPGAELYDPSSEKWTTTSPLKTGRAYHTATLLPSGKVLVAGGKAGDNLAKTAELYDPATGIWIETGILSSVRYFHTSTLLASGKVIITGGTDNGGYSRTSDIYNPTTGAWTVGAVLNTSRYSHNATLLPNNKVLLTGGDGTFATPEIYDETLLPSWEVTGPLQNGRRGHAAVLLSNRKVMIAGGSGNSGAFSSAELYDPSIAVWTATGSMNSARNNATATVLPNGRVLIVGGGGDSGSLSSAELYDPTTAIWQKTGSMLKARDGCTVTLLPNGKLLAVGGSGNSVDDSGLLSSAEIYDPASGTWAATGALNSPRSLHAAALLPDGKVLIVGGIAMSSDGFLSTTASTELYDPTTEIWTLSPPALVARRGATATSLPDGRVLVVGGDRKPAPQPGFVVSSAEIYDPGAGAWTATGAMNAERTSHTTTLLSSGNVLVVGGPPPLGAGNVSTSAELYDSTTGVWTLTDPLYTGHISHTATLLADGKVLVVGGDDRTKRSVELYDEAPMPGLDALPTVSITSPSDGATFILGTNLTISADAADSDGSITNVSFFSGTNFFGEAALAPYAVTWSNLTIGTFTLTARAIDNQGSNTVSAPIRIIVVAAANTPPTVSLTNPTNGAVFLEGTNLTISATAFDSDGSVKNVFFASGVELIGQTGTAPYSITWSNLTIGTFTLTALAIDDQGAKTVSAPIQITVVSAANTPPTVSLTSLTNGATFREGINLTISADASDSDGSVTNVSFFSGNELIGETGTPPYSITWSNLTIGAFTLTARATDSQGLTTVSDPVQISVVQSNLVGSRFASVTVSQDGSVRLLLQDVTGSSLRIETSTNLMNWLVVTNIMNPTSPFEFIDLNTNSVPQRFYRGVSSL